MTGPKPHRWIEKIAAYKPGKAKVDGVVQAVKLSANESAFGPSPKALEAFNQSADQLHRYPDPGSYDLISAIANVHGLDARKIICGAGSDELLTLLIHCFAGVGDEIICSHYGFSVYPIQALAVGATPIKVPNKNWGADVDGILAAVTPKTKLVFIDNPNNPTGAYVPWSDIERLHAGLPDHVILVLDAAYGECVDAPDYQAGEALAGRAKNVVMTRTFSKLYGLAALRVGWAYGSEDILGALHRVRMPFNVNTPAQAAACAAMLDQDHLQASVAHNAHWRKAMTADLAAMGLTVIPSQTNFLLIEFPAGMAEKAYQFLASQGYILRYLPDQGLADYLRLSIGSARENRSVIALIRDFMQESGHD